VQNCRRGLQFSFFPSSFVIFACAVEKHFLVCFVGLFNLFLCFSPSFLFSAPAEQSVRDVCCYLAMWQKKKKKKSERTDRMRGKQIFFAFHSAQRQNNG